MTAEMTTELFLADAVRTWTEKQMPGADGLADAAVSVALLSYANGASIPEATAQARLWVASWARHPSHRRTGRAGRAPLRIVGTGRAS